MSQQPGFPEYGNNPGWNDGSGQYPSQFNPNSGYVGAPAQEGSYGEQPMPAFLKQR